MELEIRELPSTDERSRQMNHLSSFKAELKRLDHEFSLTKRRVQRHQDRIKLLNADDYDEEIDTSHVEIDMPHNAKDRYDFIESILITSAMQMILKKKINIFSDL